MKVICHYNDPSKNLPEGSPDNFDYGLEKEKEYLVMGIMLFENSLEYLIDENGKPSWFPHQLFTISNTRLSQNWHFKAFPRQESDKLLFLCGFYELCCDKDFQFYTLLLERDENALSKYFQRKMEAEKEFLNG